MKQAKVLNKQEFKRLLAVAQKTERIIIRPSQCCPARFKGYHAE